MTHSEKDSPINFGSVTPTSAVFAESRFKTLYHLHQEHVRETLGNTYFRIDSLLKETLSKRVEAQIARLEKIDARIEHLHELYNRYQTAHAEARMPELRDDAFQNLPRHRSVTAEMV